MNQDIPALRFANFKNKWQETTLGEVSTITMGQSPKSSAYNNLGLGLPLIQGNADIKNRRSMPQLYTTQITKEIDKNDVLLTVRAPVGHVALSNHNACIGRGVAGIKATDNTFIFYSLLKNEHQWLKYSQGSTFTSINSDVIDQFPIKTPSEEEQAEIGKFFELLDQNLKAKEKEIKKMNELKKAYMQQIFNQEIRFKDENSKFYPSWEKKRIGEIADSFSGGTPSSSKKEYYSGTIPFIRSGEIKKRKTKLYISKQALENSSAKMVEVGDLLIALYGATSGQVSISKINGAINQAILCLRTTEDNLFIMYQWDFYKDQIINKYIQGGQGNLSGSLVKDVFLNFPIIEEQKKIGKFLSLIDQKIELKNQELEKIKKYKKAFLQKMFI